MEIQSDSGMAQASQAMTRETFGAQVVTKTLDYMNTSNHFSGSTDADYDFQQKVLSAAFADQGTLINKLV
ncbi:hypothetical protein [Desulfonatronovibrio hydrogenovorans]|uniref:hypothetical protein n=1 Tax=Desulfonatronovibrio hydrogenovorans TaxID=53245 RepID=UPI00048A7679|nr:hypothetical protein [Desulfonatronovibrio hydrogenovorans]